MNYMMIGVFAFLITGSVGMFYATVRKTKKEKEAAPATPPFDSTGNFFETKENTPPSSDGARSVVRPTTQREQRLDEIKARRETGLCLYCDKRATHVVPQITLLRPLLDPLYRRLNVVPVNHWAIDIAPGIEIPHDICGNHHAISRGHLERRIAENQVDYAAFVERQRHEMYEYEVYALDERMLDDANTVKRGKKQKKVAEVALLQRPNLKVANGNGG